ncbi:MAG TPA: endonuclease III [Gemmataceae bacterium]|nr:endonuclease III [Gemmataceae bacterium]
MSKARPSRERKRPEGKRPFDIEEAMPRLREAVASYPRAALFELAAEGHTSVFEILVACIISIRTRDETTLPVARALFAQARTPKEVADLSVAQIDQFIHLCAFHEPKAKTIHDIATQTVQAHGGELPCDREVLLSFHGVGPKCANLTLGIACGLPLIGVDIHVHRVTNRWGEVRTATPEKTMAALQEKLPRDYWIEINALLVPFGKHVCTGTRPKCSTCPLLEMCQQVGVASHR